jgi:hypothetical protein
MAMLRSLALISLLGLTSCDAAAPTNNIAEPVAAKPGDAVDDGRADCAIGPGAIWGRDCLIERGEDKAILTLRHPDGGFRRLRIVTDGRGVVPADGSEEARVTITGDRSIEVSIGQDRYRLPATLAAPAP